jgi:hypothetical protein
MEKWASPIRSETVLLESVGMPRPARRYEIWKRLGECRDAIACGAVRDCTQIDPATALAPT